jgi:hypothetical protein
MEAGSTYREFRYLDLSPGPLNPRKLFDRYKLDTLEESIRANKILVPLTVYRDKKSNKIYILDGERRWRCAEMIELGEVSTKIDIPKGHLKIPNSLKSILTYDDSTKILAHRSPIDESRRDELLGILDTKVWKSAIETLYQLSQQRPPKQVPIPVNIVDPPSPSANMLYMFHVHNLREQWELMPTALSLEILMKELNEEDESKLSELTNLSVAHVRRCKILLTFDKKYQNMMLDPDPQARIKANLFIEMSPVLDLYRDLGSRVSANNSRDELTDIFIYKYTEGKIPSVIHFRRILEAYDFMTGDPEREDRIDDFKNAAKNFVKDKDTTIKSLFEPLIVEDKKSSDALQLCNDFLSQLKRLKIEHSVQTKSKQKALLVSLDAVERTVKSLKDSLSGTD